MFSFNRKFTRILKIIVAFSCLFVLSLTLTGCKDNTPENFSIEKLSVKINGVESNSMIVTTVDENVVLKAILAGGDKIENREYCVDWEILGDELGCEIEKDTSFSDGTQAHMQLGNMGGDVKIKVTATSENIKETELSIKIVETTAGVSYPILPSTFSPDVISLQVSQSFYPEDVEMISVYWSNNTNETITFGNIYNIEKQVDASFESVMENTFFLAPDQYLLSPNQWTKISYDTSSYAGHLSAGIYRIGAKYAINGESFSIYAPFAIKPSLWYQIPEGSINLPTSWNYTSLPTHFTIVSSTAELNEVATTYDSEYFDEDYFEEKQLIIYSTYLSCINDTLSLTQLQSNENTLTFYYDYHPGMLTAIGHYQTIIEVNLESVENITNYEIKHQCNCALTKVNSIAVILTVDATSLAYKNNKTYTPEDFPEYPITSVNNLFTGPPTGPEFKRILYLYFANPVHPQDKTLQEAIAQIANRQDVYVAELSG